jgi:toxin HigB-1
MIRSLACAASEALFGSRAVSRFRSVERVARRRLLQILAYTELVSLRTHRATSWRH